MIPPIPKLGLAQVDDQHLKLWSLIEDLEAGASPRAVPVALMALEAYTIYHFKTEEALMERHQLPGSAEHKGEHQAFRARLRELARQLRNEGELAAEPVIAFLRNWLITHIRVSDARLAVEVRRLNLVAAG